MTANTKWPRLGHKKSVFMDGCVELYKGRGNRLSSLVVSTDGHGNPKVDFTLPENGIYSLIPAGAEFPKTHVKHRCGVQAPLEAALVIQKESDFEFINNHLELSAELRLGRQKLGLAGFLADIVSSAFASVRAIEAFNMACVQAVAANETTEAASSIDPLEAAAPTSPRPDQKKRSAPPSSGMQQRRRAKK